MTPIKVFESLEGLALSRFEGGRVLPRADGSISGHDVEIHVTTTMVVRDHHAGRTELVKRYIFVLDVNRVSRDKLIAAISKN